MPEQSSSLTTVAPRSWSATIRGAVSAHSDFLLPAVGYAILLAALLGSDLSTFASHLPRHPNANDAQLIAWILAWVSHAAVSPVATILDANINFPSPAQLTSSDYFLSSQIVFAPLWWATGNPVLAVNLTALASYWLAGLCGERLLRAVGCRPGVAFAGGTAVMLGPLQIPFNVHVLQYPVFLLPALALALVRLREHPDPRRAAVVAAIFACGLWASMYAAMLLGVTALIWATCELLRPLHRRMAFLMLGLAAAVVAALTVVPVVAAYLDRAAAQPMHDPRASQASLVEQLVNPTLQRFRFAGLNADTLLIGISLVAVAGFARRVPAARRLLAPAIACIVVGDAVSLGVPPALDKTAVAEVFRFVRYFHRFTQVSGFGWTLLFAAGLQTIVGWLPPRAGPLASAIVLLLVIAGKHSLGGGPIQEVVSLGRDRTVHRTIGDIVQANGGGAMLQLPQYGLRHEGANAPELVEVDAMLASTVHWLPLVNGYTGHQPGQRLLVSELIRALPDREALEDLIDATHLRWIVLREARLWPPDRPRAPVERALRASPAVGRAWDVQGWLLLEIVRPPLHPAWYQTIAAGRFESTTVLGTPLRPLPPDSDVGMVTSLRPLPARLAVKQAAWVDLRVANLGSATWPVSAAPHPGLVLDIALRPPPGQPFTVVLVERWIPIGSEPGAATRRLTVLRRDLLPGESLRQKTLLVAPSQPGRYRLELSLEQVDGARFTGPGNVPLVQEVLITPKTDASGSKNGLPDAAARAP